MAGTHPRHCGTFAPRAMSLAALANRMPISQIINDMAAPDVRNVALFHMSGVVCS